MGAKHFTELRAWQAANGLKLLIYAYTENPPASNDRRYCEHTRAAIESVTANIAEGFARYDHKEFAHFLKIAKSSLAETQSHMRDAFDRKYVSQVSYDEMLSVSVDAMKSITRLYTYLRTHAAPAVPATHVQQP